MDAVGAEVGQKMRSAIKAKLTELECYVDDELPDYIMVMVANKRSKSQMNEDLTLFLNNKTSTFVDWLHIVLKKLKEVTVTNPEVYKKAIKRKTSTEDELKVKKEKKDKPKKPAEVKKEPRSLTDDLPININRMSESRKIVVTKDNSDGFDIPLLSEAKKLEEIEDRIKTVKKRLGGIVNSDDDEESLQQKADKLKAKRIVIESKNGDKSDVNKTDDQKESRKLERKRITFPDEDTKTASKGSALNRLGKRSSDRKDEPLDKKRRLPDVRSQINKNRNDGRKKNFQKEGILSRLGVMSKVSVPEKPLDERVEMKEVRSMITVKPRSIPPNAQLANKNLILKAVADAQRSIAQAPVVGINSNPSALYTKNYLKQKEKPTVAKVAAQSKNKLKNMLESISENRLQYSDSDGEEYVPKPVNKSPYTSPSYTPTSATSPSYTPTSPTFVVNLNKSYQEVRSGKISPIIFDPSTPVSTSKPMPNVPDTLPKVAIAKKKEPCKYYPNCKWGDKCEYTHVRKSCEMFPYCSFGESCMYTHPSCKFGVSCTKRDCPYSHGRGKTEFAKLCKFGKFCKNADCKFGHTFIGPNRKLKS